MEKKSLTSLMIFERYAGKVLWCFVQLIFIILFFRFFIISPGIVNGPSMEPNYVDEDLFFVNRLIYLLSSPKRGDVVSLIDLASNKLVIKRIVGLQGEIVVIKRGKVYIQNSLEQEPYELPESYLEKNSITKTSVYQEGVKRFLVGSGQYYVLGDNRDRSTDSRLYGPVLRSNIIGKVFWPNKKESK